MDKQIDRTELLIDGLTLWQTDRKADRQTDINQSILYFNTFRRGAKNSFKTRTCINDDDVLTSDCLVIPPVTQYHNLFRHLLPLDITWKKDRKKTGLKRDRTIQLHTYRSTYIDNQTYRLWGSIRQTDRRVNGDFLMPLPFLLRTRLPIQGTVYDRFRKWWCTTDMIS